MCHLEPELVDQVFDVFVRDFSRFAVGLHGKPSTTEVQAGYCLRMVQRPAEDAGRTAKVWDNHVYALRDAYEMQP